MPGCNELGMVAMHHTGIQSHFLMLLTRSAAAGSFILSRNSAKLRGCVASAS